MCSRTDSPSRTAGFAVGEVRSQEDAPTELIIEWAELVWEPISD